MCGRYVLGISPEELADFFELSEIRLSYQPRFNVAPTTLIPVIRRGKAGFAKPSRCGGASFPPGLGQANVFRS